MVFEGKLQRWIEAGLALFRDTPLLVELVFMDASHRGTPTTLANGLCTDTAKLWIPEEHTGGVLRWGNTTFPILGNTARSLTVTGDPSLFDDPDTLGYTIVPPAALELSTLLTTQPLPKVLTSWAQLPTELPAFTIRLQSDTEDPAAIGEIDEMYVDTVGTEFVFNRTHVTGHYLISIWATNRLQTLWLYSWLVNYATASQQQFASWGLSGVSLGGSDVDPLLQFLPEQVYVRHFQLTATRPEWALRLTTLDEITDFTALVDAEYALLRSTQPFP